MNVITFSKLTQLGGSKIARFLPAMVTVDGEEKFVICNKDDVLVLKGMHIRVQNMLRAMYKKAKAGMPKDVKITAEMVV